METGTPPESGLTLTSPAFEPGATIPRRYTCDGEGRNDFGRDGYGAPCPPRGSTHRYRFELLALSAEPDLAPGAGDLRRAVAGEGWGALLVATYGR